MAEALIRRNLRQLDIEGVHVESAGTDAWDGIPASEGSVIVAAENGLDLASHQAQSLSSELVARSDLLLAMEFHHAAEAARIGGAGRTHLLGEYAGLERHEAEVDDPYGARLPAYREMFRTLEPLTRRAVERFVLRDDLVSRSSRLAAASCLQPRPDSMCNE